MGLKTRRANSPHGKYSKTLVIPAGLKTGKESTIAANRLMVVDPRGEIPEGDLLDFLEKYIEPEFWPWLKEKEKEAQQKISERYEKHICPKCGCTEVNQQLDPDGDGGDPICKKCGYRLGDDWYADYAEEKETAP